MLARDASGFPDQPVQVAHPVGHPALGGAAGHPSDARRIVASKLVRREIVKRALLRGMTVRKGAVDADHRRDVTAAVDVIDELELIRELVARELDETTLELTIVTAHILIDVTLHEVQCEVEVSDVGCEFSLIRFLLVFVDFYSKRPIGIVLANVFHSEIDRWPLDAMRVTFHYL